jgi:putative nucleotidyltransferase with HDIG domain
MLTPADADDLIDRHLGEGFRAEHSRLVGTLMHELAAMTGADADLWRLAGLCHDLDYEATRSIPEQHGLVAAGWLRGRLPEEALLAIEAHDHRTGTHADGPLAHALKLADALALYAAWAGSTPLLDALRAGDPQKRLLACLPDRPWLADMVVRHAATLDLEPTALAGAMVRATSAYPSSAPRV